ncbi:hypothetical protein T4D_11307 [Trichinella pseudospiralis]|uniref:PiggyBac transposable element-derived protein domain-containing protein n=1 Tax=Trichinella pseudospiralis TaxID=6337 RepID=A0A0V1F715_TRIPS|nr:hypothetical protein T4D_11307 [Trichinella pseudospiralis]
MDQKDRGQNQGFFGLLLLAASCHVRKEPVLDKWSEESHYKFFRSWRELISPNAYLFVDEHLLPFDGQCPFRVIWIKVIGCEAGYWSLSLLQRAR